MINLAVGHLEIDWGKNQIHQDYSALFQGEADVADIPYYYAGEDHYTGEEDGTDVEDDIKPKPISEFKEGMSKPLFQVIDRIALLGHTYKQCEREFAFLAAMHGFDSSRFRFEQLHDALTSVDVETISADYSEGNGENFGEFFRDEVAPRLGLKLDPIKARGVPEAMENLSAYGILHLLALNPSACDLPVQWAFNEIQEYPHVRREDYVCSLGSRDRFLIVTKESSDVAILRHALKILRPHVADFFDFVDMQEGYPFSGTGNVFRFVQGLISISVQNDILVLFDNHAEGVANYERCCRELKVLSNMRILKLPNLPVLKAFLTIGPNGEQKADINGRAAAIECYVDLDAHARIRWTSYNTKTNTYQGELEGKTRYMLDFLGQRVRKSSYDYSRLEVILDAIIDTAIAMREINVAKDWERAFEEVAP